MSDIPTPGAESATHTASPGILLSNERVKRGLSLQEVADRLKLSRKQLEAIENDEYDKLPGATFARGFVRNYAKLLGLDPAVLNASLDAHLPALNIHAPVHAPAAPAPQEAPAPVASPAQSSRPLDPRLIKGGLAVLALLVVAGLGYRTVTQGGSVSTPPLAAPAPQAALSIPSTEAPAPASLAAPSDVKSEPLKTEPAPVAAAKPAELKPPVAAPADVKPVEVKPAEVKPGNVGAGAAQAAVSDTGAGEVVLRAKATAWVSVIDAKGKKLLYDQITGEKRISGGTPPYKLTIGNAQQVELNYKGQAVPLADKTKGNTAKLELQ